MSRPPIFDALFPNGDVLFYRGTFNGKPFTRHWARFDREVEQGYQLSFYLELDPAPLGQGTTVHRERCRLLLSKELAPLGYITEAAGTRLVISIANETATVRLPDRTELTVPFKHSHTIAEANITGLDALTFALAHERGELASLSTTIFLVNQLLEIPYSLTRDGQTYKSSYDEQLVIDDQGVLQSTEVAKAGVRFERAPAPPLPHWANLPDGTRATEAMFYVLPKDATFKLANVSVATARGESGGSLAIPQGKGPFPTVLFLSGTGSHDRHGFSGNLDLGTHEICDYLADHGILTLRFDTRGAGTTKAGAAALDASLTPIIDDARAWYRYLSARPDVDPHRIMLVGHSQGGTIALLLATGPDRLAISKLVLMATPGRPLLEILSDQIVTRSNELALPAEQRDKQLAEYHELVEAVRSGKSFEAGGVPDYLIPMARSVAWFKDHLDLDPATLIAEVPCPILVVQGDKDFQVTVADSDRLADAARRAGKPVELVVAHDVDHLFKVCTGVSTLDSYYDPTRRVDTTVLSRLAGWLQ